MRVDAGARAADHGARVAKDDELYDRTADAVSLDEIRLVTVPGLTAAFRTPKNPRMVNTGRSPVAHQPLEEAVRCPLLDRDPEAWLRCCTARFLPVARRVAGDDATARDALQESWIIVLEKLYQYRGGPPACGWVGVIVRHEAGHAAARTNRDAPLPPDGLAAGAEDLDGTLYRRSPDGVLLGVGPPLIRFAPPPLFRVGENALLVFEARRALLRGEGLLGWNAEPRNRETDDDDRCTDEADDDDRE